jgi:hypothetical protein
MGNVRVHIFNWAIIKWAFYFCRYLKRSTCQRLLSHWSVHLTVLLMLGWLKINERLPDMTPTGCWMKGYLTWPQQNVEWKVYLTWPQWDVEWKVTWHGPNRMLNERTPDMTPMGCWMKCYLTWPQRDVEWKVTWHDPNGMLLDVSVSTRKKERYNI